MKVIPVILAGGIGERFWPFSRTSKPKQLLPLLSSRSMIEETFSRVGPFCKKGSRPLIVTGKVMAGKIKRALSKALAYDSLVEPVGKNTAPAVAIAAAWIKKKYGSDAVMIVLSADHAISPKKDFVAAVKYAVELADTREDLIVFGIHPSRPDTGYGYIQLQKNLESRGNLKSHVVKRFVEKPTQKKAEQYIATKKYLWNSGMFVWKVSVILEEFKQHMPKIHAGVVKAAKAGFTQKAVDAFYHAAQKESIDFGIMEQSRRVSAVEGVFSWDDLGSWESLSRVLIPNKAKTTVSGKKVYEKECSGSIVANNSGLTVAAVGLEDTVVAV
ncbi:MAG: mannose-1-phosphate guanylyltransferase, partial [bacterium]|nr:mannose-1-phosphate guanylyltransferase [bacterium]